MKKVQKFHCPQCGADLRKVGVIVWEDARLDIIFTFDEKGKYLESKEFDGETLDYSARCAHCLTELNLDLAELYFKLPKKIEVL